jgi:hypothetical protein
MYSQQLEDLIQSLNLNFNQKCENMTKKLKQKEVYFLNKYIFNFL